MLLVLRQSRDCRKELHESADFTAAATHVAVQPTVPAVQAILASKVAGDSCVTGGDKREQQPVFVVSTIPFFFRLKNSQSGSNKLFPVTVCLLGCRTFSRAQYQMSVRFFKKITDEFRRMRTRRMANLCTVVSVLQFSLSPSQKTLFKPIAGNRILAKSRVFFFLFLKRQDLLLLSGYRGATPRVKWPGRGTDQSPPSSAEVKNEWRCISIPLSTFVACMKTTLTLQFPSRICHMSFQCIRTYE
jgi:hypothetical protein